MPERVRSWRRASTSFSLLSIGASAERRRRPFSRSSAGNVATRSRSFSEVWLISAGCILPLSAAEIRELKRDAEVRAAQESNGGLQIVLLLARDAQLLALDRDLHLQLAVLDGLYDLPRLFGGNALADRQDLSHGTLGRGLDRAVVESLQGHAPLRELRLEQVRHGLQAELVVRRERELLVLLLDSGRGALQVEALPDFFPGLRDRVRDLGEVDFGDDVERGFGHGLTPRGSSCPPAARGRSPNPGASARAFSA